MEDEQCVAVFSVEKHRHTLLIETATHCRLSHWTVYSQSSVHATLFPTYVVEDNIFLRNHNPTFWR